MPERAGHILSQVGQQHGQGNSASPARQSFLGGLSLLELAKRTWSEAQEDQAFSHAAELAFYFLLAFFPLLIFLLSVLGFLPSAQQLLIDYLTQVLPREAAELLRQWVNNVANQTTGGLLSFSLLGSLWAASSGLVALIHALNIAYEVEEERPWWKARLVALGLVLTLTVFILGGALLIIFSDTLAATLANWFGLGQIFTTVWPYVDYSLGLALLVIGVGLIYHLAPNAEQNWRWITPGAVFAVAALVASSLLFSLYLEYGPGYSATYGSLGAGIVLILWLYLLGLVIFLGGEVNAEVKRAAGQAIRQKEESNHQEQP